MPSQLSTMAGSRKRPFRTPIQPSKFDSDQYSSQNNAFLPDHQPTKKLRRACHQPPIKIFQDPTTPLDSPDSALSNASIPEPIRSPPITKSIVKPCNFYVEIPRLQDIKQRPLQQINYNGNGLIDLLDICHRPDKKISIAATRKWQQNQPNDHTSTFSTLFR
jgi:hypothetical protein